MSKEAPNVRYAEVERETKETRIQVVLDLDGGNRVDVQTGIAFFDHMLVAMAFYSGLNLGVACEGDLQVDDHHTVEDVGICIGKAIKEALDGSDPIHRFGSIHATMDESLALVALDISGRGMLTYDCAFTRENLGGLATENVREFFRALAMHSGISLHIHRVTSANDHHLCEAVFKGFGLALAQAVRRNETRMGISTKGKKD